jgi:hypothetical protein
MFILEEKELIAEKLREHQHKLKIELSKTPAANWLRCHVAWVEALIKKVCQTPVIELRLCETEQLVLKPRVLYHFTVDPACARCKELDKLGNPG